MVLLVNIRILIIVFKFVGFLRKVEIVGKFIDIKEFVILDGEIVDYEYMFFMVNVIFKYNGK